MEGELVENDTARHSTPSYRDTVRHSLTIPQAVELFVHLDVPRSKRSVQRFCEQGHLDCVRIKGARGDQFFINRESVERYAEELRQIEAVATIGAEPRYDAQQHAVARNSAPDSDSTTAAPAADPAPTQTPTPDSQATIQRLEGEVLNLRIDNRGKEQAINFLTGQAREKDQHLHDLSYRLGAAETRLAQLEAPKAHDDQERQTAPERASDPIEAIIVPTSPSTIPESTPPEPELEPQQPAPRRSVFGRLFG
jgi:hypothetical protein